MSSLINFINVHPTISLLLIIWAIVWKLIALWKAARHSHLTIFIVLGFLNTLGIAEIIYITYLYLKEKKNQVTK